MVESTWPDTFEIIEPTRDPVKIVFSERISERPSEGRSLDAAVLVSPMTGEHRAKHRRSGLEIEVIGGFQPGLVYRVRLLPTVRDMFGNGLQGPFELVFGTTGAVFEENVIAGIAEDRITGEVVEGVRAEAEIRGVEDTPVHVAVTDSLGVFAFRYLPAGLYDISVYQDVNLNTEMDFSELQGWAESELLPEEAAADTAIIRQVTLLRPDTTPSRLILVEAMDSVLIRVSFDDYMDSEGPLEEILVQLTQEEEPGPEIDGLLWPRQMDSLLAFNDSVAAEEERLALVDSLSTVADSLEQTLAGFTEAGDTLGADSVGTRLEQIRDLMAPPEPPEEPEPGAEVELPPILPQQEFFIYLAEPLVGEQLYTAVISGVTNINGLSGGGGEASFTWEPPEPPPEEVPDTSAVPDTAGVPPDTGSVAPPDTGSVAPPDTGSVAPPHTSRGDPPGPKAVARPSPSFLRRP